jgi:hypothetical protein
MITITRAAAMTRASTKEKPWRFAEGVDGFLSMLLSKEIPLKRTT